MVNLPNVRKMFKDVRVWLVDDLDILEKGTKHYYKQHVGLFEPQGPPAPPKPKAAHAVAPKIASPAKPLFGRKLFTPGAEHVALNFEFEQKHPRGEGGKFAEKPGGEEAAKVERPPAPEPPKVAGVPIESLAEWGPPKSVTTKDGPRILRTAKPTEKFWNLWRARPAPGVSGDV